LFCLFRTTNAHIEENFFQTPARAVMAALRAGGHATPVGLVGGVTSLPGIGDPNAVPEPASWAMLMAGFGLIGATMRRRKSANVVAS
jgi:hypothetical protein